MRAFFSSPTMNALRIHVELAGQASTGTAVHGSKPVVVMAVRRKALISGACIGPGMVSQPNGSVRHVVNAETLAHARQPVPCPARRVKDLRAKFGKLAPSHGKIAPHGGSLASCRHEAIGTRRQCMATPAARPERAAVCARQLVLCRSARAMHDKRRRNKARTSRQIYFAFTASKARFGG